MKYLKYILGILIIVVPSVLTVLIYNDKITQNSPVYYRQGVEFYNKGDYQNAYYNFGKIKWISPLYPMAIYKQAKSAELAGDYKTAVLKYELFLKKLPNSAFDLKAKLSLGKSYYYLKQYEEAKKTFEDLVNKTNNDGTEEVFYLGLIEKNFDKQKSALYFRNYLKTALEGNALNNNYITASAEELASLGIDLNNDDLELIGISFYKNKKYNEALKYLSKLPAGRSWDYLVLANYHDGNKAITKKLIETGLVEYANDIEEENLHEIYNAYASYLNGKRSKNWQTVYNIVKNNKLKGEDYILYKFTEVFPQNKMEYYKEITALYPNSNYAPEAAWNIIWGMYKAGNYNSAELLAAEHLKTYKRVKSTPKTAFWLAKAQIKQNKLSEAHSTLSRLVNKYPDDYYGLRAESIINKKEDFWTTNLKLRLPENHEAIEFPISVSQIDLKELKVIDTLFELGDYEILKDADYHNPVVESWLNYRKEKKSLSIVQARDELEKMNVKPPLMSAVYKLAYPLYLVKEINIAGEKLGIDSYLIASIIREESYYNEHAKSATGATGLMQLMPLTANYMSSKLNEEVDKLADLEDERTNIYLGCNYLKYLKERFNNNDLMVVAAYNGGEGSVNKWMKNNKYNDMDEFIEEIPYKETKNYVKKVFRTYHMYKKIYN